MPPQICLWSSLSSGMLRIGGAHLPRLLAAAEPVAPAAPPPHPQGGQAGDTRDAPRADPAATASPRYAYLPQ